MSLRPRYSLLTLLVLTALVAGGVKWWYGPHHVVERLQEGVEHEYEFIRTWQGVPIFQGSRTVRTFNQGRIKQSWIGYYRQGKLVEWSICHLNPQFDSGFSVDSTQFLKVVQFTEPERQVHTSAIQREIQKYTDQATPVRYHSWACNWQNIY